MAKTLFHENRIVGWGADLPEENRPAVPMETPSDVYTARGAEPPAQTSHVRIHRSIEHPSLTPVFGSTCPPRGLSGLLRNFAYRFSEGRLVHWFALMAADRLDVVEGRWDDLRRGKLPHPLRERGWGAELRRGNRHRAVRRVALVTAFTGIAVLAVGLLTKKRES